MRGEISDGFGEGQDTNLMIRANTGWLYTVARRIASPSSSLLDDMVQEGRIEMWRAIQEYDPTRGELLALMRFRAKRRMSAMALLDAPPTGHTRQAGRPEVKPTTSIEERALRYESSGEDVVAMLFGLVDTIEGVEIAYHHGEIQAAIASLTPKQRAYVYARFWCGMDPEGVHMNPGVREARANNPITRRDVLWTGNKTTVGAKARLVEALDHLRGLVSQ